jgi:excisionase family DNA binding protein
MDMTNQTRAPSHKTVHGLPTQPTIKQTADFFGVDAKTIRRWISQGRLTAYRVGPRLIRIDRESILKLASPIGGAA